MTLAAQVPLDVATIHALIEHFDKEADDSIDTADRIEQRIAKGCSFPSDEHIAKHYRKNAAYFRARADAIRGLDAAHSSLTRAYEALHAEKETLQRRYDEIVDISLARRQLPDGTVPGNTVECAEGWHEAYNKLLERWNELRDLRKEQRERAEKAEAERDEARGVMADYKVQLEAATLDFYETQGQIEHLRVESTALRQENERLRKAGGGYWECRICLCRWRDNFDGTVSLFDVSQKSCRECEMKGTLQTCRWVPAELTALRSTVAGLHQEKKERFAVLTEKEYAEFERWRVAFINSDDPTFERLPNQSVAHAIAEIGELQKRLDAAESQLQSLKAERDALRKAEAEFWAPNNVALDAVHDAILSAATNWTMATPESYAQRTPIEKLQYDLWVAIKQQVEQQVQSLTRAKEEYQALAKVGVWHNDCRPNRQMAARELAKSQAVIDKLADTITELKAKLEAAEHASAARTKLWDAIANEMRLALEDHTSAIPRHTVERWVEHLARALAPLPAGEQKEA